MTSTHASLGRFSELRDAFSEISRLSRHDQLTTTTAVQGLSKGIRLHDYQQYALEWLLAAYNEERGGILGDEMGLGKTLTSLAFMAHLVESGASRGPFLILCPLTLMDHWQREARKYAPSLNLLVFHGAPDERAKQKSAVARAVAAQPASQHGDPRFDFHAVLTTYEMVTHEGAFLQRFRFRLAVADEAHRLKNADSRLHQTLRTSFAVQRFLLLTGTPVQNDLGELYAMLMLTFPAALDLSLKDLFVAWISNPGAAPLPPFTADATSSSPSRPTVSAGTHDADLRAVLARLMLRRTKDVVQLNLPPLTEVVLFTRLTTVQRNYYRWVMAKNISALGRGAAKGLSNTIMQLRKVCNHPYLFDGAEPEPFQEGDHLWQVAGKTCVLDKLLPKLRSEGHRVLLFSQSTAMLDVLQDYLAYRKMSYERLDGSVRGEERWNTVKRFRTEKTFVFLLSTRAGGVGLNLPEADTVILYDSDWNPQMDLQAIARVHRQGQSRAVKVIRLVSGGTVEEEILRRALRKLRLTQRVDGISRSATAATHPNGDGLEDAKPESLLVLLQRGLADLGLDNPDGADSGSGPDDQTAAVDDKIMKSVGTAAKRKPESMRKEDAAKCALTDAEVSEILDRVDAATTGSSDGQLALDDSSADESDLEEGVAAESPDRGVSSGGTQLLSTPSRPGRTPTASASKKRTSLSHVTQAELLAISDKRQSVGSVTGAKKSIQSTKNADARALERLMRVAKSRTPVRTPGARRAARTPAEIRAEKAAQAERRKKREAARQKRDEAQRQAIRAKWAAAGYRSVRLADVWTANDAGLISLATASRIGKVTGCRRPRTVGAGTTSDSSEDSSDEAHSDDSDVDDADDPRPQSGAALFQFVTGDAAHPNKQRIPSTHAGPCFVLHCVDDSGRWAKRGFFRAIDSISDGPRLQYAAAAAAQDLPRGSLHAVSTPVPPNPLRPVFVALSVSVQRSRRTARVTIDPSLLQLSLGTLFATAVATNGSVHVARPAPALGTWYAFERLLRRLVAATRVPTFVYYHKPRALVRQPSNVGAGAGAGAGAGRAVATAAAVGPASRATPSSSDRRAAVRGAVKRGGAVSSAGARTSPGARPKPAARTAAAAGRAKAVGPSAGGPSSAPPTVASSQNDSRARQRPRAAVPGDAGSGMRRVSAAVGPRVPSATKETAPVRAQASHQKHGGAHQAVHPSPSPAVATGDAPAAAAKDGRKRPKPQSGDAGAGGTGGKDRKAAGADPCVSAGPSEPLFKRRRAAGQRPVSLRRQAPAPSSGPSTAIPIKPLQAAVDAEVFTAAEARAWLRQGTRIPSLPVQFPRWEENLGFVASQTSGELAEAKQKAEHELARVDASDPAHKALQFMVRFMGAVLRAKEL